MLEWLRASPIVGFLNVHYSIALSIFLFPLAFFFHTSRRMNARLEAAAPGPRRLQKLDWLLVDKLKLLPDERAGKRTNFLWLLLAASLIIVAGDWIERGSTAHEALITLRYGDAVPQIQAGLWGAFLFFFLSLIPFTLPLLFARRNREFYLDVWVLFALLHVALKKLLNCWFWDCCFGIPWSHGSYNSILDTTVFPIQLLEFAVGLLLCAVCILYMLYGKSYRPGYGCSVCLISYAAPRFFWDYLRYLGEGYRPVENLGIFGLTMVQTVCIAAVILGIAWPFLLPLEKKLLDKF